MVRRGPDLVPLPSVERVEIRPLGLASLIQPYQAISL